jgi:DMSO/TMAO reductase YedYZ molybdopterin-dependent catalytic subunit
MRPIDARPAHDRLPPGQIETKKWPVLHYGMVPHVDTATWKFRVWGEVEKPFELTWDEMQQLPQLDVLCDIHCVTRWSRFDNTFRGASVQELLRRAKPKKSAEFALAHAAPDYTTNLPLSDLDRAENLVAFTHNGAPLTPEHGGPVRLLVPHLYFWKSAKWLTGIELLTDDEAGFWEMNGYHMRGDPFTEERFGRPNPARMRRGPRG